MSSYPGAISSTDDFIFKKGQYFVTETSLGDLTESKVNKINIKEVDLLEFIKCQAALMTAKTAVRIFILKKYEKVLMLRS